MNFVACPSPPQPLPRTPPQGRQLGHWNFLKVNSLLLWCYLASLRLSIYCGEPRGEIMQGYFSKYVIYVPLQ